ncbi:MAG: leucine-rich repeat domain-containing protein [Bacilli bacterium]|nr:leucine-rich repeat domain-containing protein [Bacilli bacterium]
MDISGSDYQFDVRRGAITKFKPFKASLDVIYNKDVSQGTIYRYGQTKEEAEQLALELEEEYLKTFYGKSKFFSNISIERIKHLYIDIPATAILSGVFEDQELESVRISSPISFIGQRAFKGNHLKQIKFPDTLGTIGKEAFADNELSYVLIPKKVTSIWERSFANNEIQAVNFETQTELTYIGDQAFINNNIKSIILPKNVNRYTGAFDEETNVVTTSINNKRNRLVYTKKAGNH